MFLLNGLQIQANISKHAQSQFHYCNWQAKTTAVSELVITADKICVGNRDFVF